MPEIISSLLLLLLVPASAKILLPAPATLFTLLELPSYSWELGRTELSDFLVWENSTIIDDCSIHGYWKADGFTNNLTDLAVSKDCQTLTGREITLQRWYFAPESFRNDVYKIPHASEMDCAFSNWVPVTMFNVSIRNRDGKLCPLDLETARYKEALFGASVFIDFGHFEGWLTCIIHDGFHLACFFLAVYHVLYDNLMSKQLLKIISNGLVILVIPML